MKIIIDECLPKRLTRIFSEHDVWTVPQIGLAGIEDGILLDELNMRDIDLFVTMDGNIEFQQQFINRKFSTLIIQSVSNRLNDLLHLENNILTIISKIEPGIVLYVTND